MGRRADRLRKRRRLRRIVTVVLVVVLAGAGGGTYLAVAHHPKKKIHAAIYGTPDQGPQIVTLLAMDAHGAKSGRADSLTLFAIDRTGDSPVTLFVPTRTLTQVPAFAYTSIGDALIDTPFLERISLENMIGISVDDVVTFDDVVMGRFINSLGGLDIDVDQDVYVTNDAGGRVLEFQHGPQHMDAATAVLYMTDIGDGQNELDRFPRQHQVWNAILSLGREKIQNALASLTDADVDPDQRQALSLVLGAIAAAPDGERAWETMPVTTVISGGPEEAYQVDTSNLDAMAQRDFAASTFGTVPSARPSIEIQNGTGVAGAGERPAALLVEDGFKIAIARNADSFRHAHTTITVYGQNDAARALADRLRTLLGRGAVQFAPQGQTVVQATIVIGRDFVNP
ncbi:MAG: LCP family protein [Actinobacteria bacterium]|nr:LCP family protein [Actinomycetota bacterium]